MILDDLCPPALLYVVFTITHIIIDIFKRLYNLAFIKFVVMIIFTLLLNVLCSTGLTIVSWVIVFLPFIMMTIITSLMLYTFGLDEATGKMKYKVDYPDNHHQRRGRKGHRGGGGRGDDDDSDSDSDDDDYPKPYNNDDGHKHKKTKHRRDDGVPDDILPTHRNKKIKARCQQVPGSEKCNSVGKPCMLNDIGCEKSGDDTVGCASCDYNIGCKCEPVNERHHNPKDRKHKHHHREEHHQNHQHHRHHQHHQHHP